MTLRSTSAVIGVILVLVYAIGSGIWIAIVTTLAWGYSVRN